jgi:hypothetical protein
MEIGKRDGYQNNFENNLPNPALKRTWPSVWRYRWRLFGIQHKIVKGCLFEIDRPVRLALCVGRLVDREGCY